MINIDKIKNAINLGGNLVSPNSDGTMMIIPPDLSYFGGILLTAEEYQIYINATTLTIAEKIKRLLANQTPDFDDKKPLQTVAEIFNKMDDIE